MLYLDYGRQDKSVKNKDGGNIDYGAVEFIKALNTAVLAKNPGVITIAEESTTYTYVTKPPYEGGLGFSFKWNMGFMHDTLDFMRGDPYFRHGAHDKMTFSMHYAFSENYILPYSHDEVVHGKASMIGKMFGDYDDKFAALKTLYGWQYAHPGKKLLFMGSEFAQFIEWDYKKELDWFLLDYDSHTGMQEWVRALNRLYRRRSALHADDKGWDGFQWLNVSDSKNSVFAFRRSDGRSHVVCVFNFSTEDFAKYDVALPHPGRLRLVLSSVSGETKPKETKPKKTIRAKPKELNEMPCSATLSLPKLSVLFYDYMLETV
jgi:1,4-alpha-glucan branching enzyme